MRGLSIALSWLLGIAAVVAVAVVGAFLYRRDLLERARSGDPPGIEAADRADTLVEATIGWSFIIGIAILVVLIVFLFRASKNTHLWQQGHARWSPGWTIGGWFVPFANVVIPFLVVRDIWRRSRQRDIDGTQRNVPASLVGWWWVSWMAGSVLMRAGGVIAGESPTVAELSSADLTRAAAALMHAIAALLLLSVVRQLGQRQEQLGHPAHQPLDRVSALGRPSPTRVL